MTSDDTHTESPQKELLSEAQKQINKQEKQTVLKKLYEIPTIAHIFYDMAKSANGEENVLYKLVIPHQLKEENIHLVQRADGIGSTLNLVKDGDNKILGQARAIAVPTDILPNLFQSAERMALQAKLGEITDRLENIEQITKSILQGQRDDRIGLLISGIDLYRKGLLSTNPINRQSFLTGSIEQITEARSRLIKAIETDTRSLKIPKNLQEMILNFRKNTTQILQEKSDILAIDFQNILWATHFLAHAFQSIGETALMKDCWDPIKTLLPAIQEIRKKILPWLPADPNILTADNLGTILTVAEFAIEKLNLLSSGIQEDIIIEFSAKEILGDLND